VASIISATNCPNMAVRVVRSYMIYDVPYHFSL
jgi:hypothetical protein